jgi:hypothetical protein
VGTYPYSIETSDNGHITSKVCTGNNMCKNGTLFLTALCGLRVKIILHKN